ncbi:MAG: FixH family protein [Rubellimicrobium sp.]|nr:FixH family protein [Rubellimicrobium sp.]
MTRLFRAPLTGPKVFAMFAAFFAVIIAVNVLMAWRAIATFPGVEVANSYVASQTFDRDRAAQEALGWTASVAVEDGELQVAITGRDGQPAQIAGISAIFGRPTEARDDQVPAFVRDGGLFRAPVVAGPGNWYLRLEVTAPDGTMFRQRLTVAVN